MSAGWESSQFSGQIRKKKTPIFRKRTSATLYRLMSNNSQSSPQERKEYHLNVFAKARETLIEVLTLEDMPEEHRKEAEETLASVERNLEFLRTS